MPKGSPLVPLGIHAPHHPWAILRASTTFTCQSICNFFTLPHPTNCISPQDKGLVAVGVTGSLDAWPQDCACHPLPHHPCACHSGLWMPLPSLPLLCITLNLCVSDPYPPTLAGPVLFHENGSPVHPDCMLIDQLILNSLLHWWEELSFLEFLLQQRYSMTQN